MDLREATFEVPLDIPTTPQTKAFFRSYLMQIAEQLGNFGDGCQPVGIGFVWESRKGVTGATLLTLSRRMQRALKSSGILSFRAEPYNLTQKVNYIIGDGEPHAIFKIREGWKQEE